MGKEKRPFCCHKIFVPSGLSAPAWGYTLEPKLLYLPKKRLEVTSSAIVVLTTFLDSPNLPKEDLSGLRGKFSWRDT